MDPVLRIALTPEENAKVTPLEVLEDFAHSTRNWVYLEEASRHYTQEKNAPALILRRRVPPSTYVDLAFANLNPETNRLEFVLFDEPGAEQHLSAEERSQVVESFLEDLRDHLQTRPDHVRLHVERGPVDAPTRAS